MICCGARPVYIAQDRFGWHAVYQLSFTFATRSYHKLNFEPTYFFRYRAFLCGANSREKRASRNSFLSQERSISTYSLKNTYSFDTPIPLTHTAFA